MAVGDKSRAPETSFVQRVPMKRILKVVAAVLGGLAGLFGILGISICTVIHPFDFPKKVTVLVPVQGETSDQQDPPYASKISRDTVTTVARARRLYESNKGALGNAVVFVHYPEGADARSRYDQAIQQIDLAASENRPAVAVIGHTSSQATLDAGPAYAKHGLTILMPYATRTDISRELCALEGKISHTTHRHTPFALALPPPNAQQAATIAGFLRERLSPDPDKAAKGAAQKPSRVPKVVLFRDALNAAYSADCANRLQELLEEVPSGKSEPPIEVIADISAGGTSGQWYISDELVKAKPDAVVVIGGTKVAVEVLRQAKAVGLNPRFTILTDGAVDLNLVSRVKQALSTDGTQGVLPGEVFVMFPESAVVPNGYEPIFTEDASAYRNIRGLSHAAFLSDAVYLAMMSIRNAHVQSSDCLPQIIDRYWHRKPSGPSVLFLDQLQAAMSTNVGSKGYAISAGLLLGSKRTYEFSEVGTRSEENLQYYVYRLVPDAALDDLKQGYERVPFTLAK
jgi:ABC-type branched-subunit amino acid transport system substrate-binding protein